MQDALGQVPSGADNLAYRAADRIRQLSGIHCGATIRITKRIPAAAGLGGASSDAAATLLAANMIWAIHWPLGQLLEVAVDIGSDVPFFLSGGAALCRGRGERIEPVALAGNWHFVVVRPPVGLSTAEVYRHCKPAERPHGADALVVALSKGGTVDLGRLMFNRLQAAASRLTPWIEQLSHEFEQLDCLGHQMSGSGTSYFGLCHHARHARRVASRLRARVRGCPRGIDFDCVHARFRGSERLVRREPHENH